MVLVFLGLGYLYLSPLLLVALCIVHKWTSAKRLLPSLSHVTSTFFFRGGLFLATDDYAPISRNIVSRQPTSDDEAQALRYAYTVLMSTVSLTLLSRVRLFPGR